MIPDRIGSPPHHCREHDEWFYFHCIKCFAPRYAEPIHLRVTPVRGNRGSGGASSERPPPASGYES
jgi:hypothetical protein